MYSTIVEVPKYFDSLNACSFGFVKLSLALSYRCVPDFTAILISPKGLKHCLDLVYLCMKLLIIDYIKRPKLFTAFLVSLRVL